MTAPIAHPAQDQAALRAPLERTAASTFDRVSKDVAHAAFPEMADALRARVQRILIRWRKRSLEAMPHLDSLTLEEFENTIAIILNAAADAFASADSRELRGVIDTGGQHGIDRFVSQYFVLDLFEEVRILRGVIIIEIAEQMKRPLHVGEAATFHAIFDIIIQLGVMTLVRKQSEELQQAHHTMRDVNQRLLVSSVLQTELTEQAEKSEAALRKSEADFRMVADNIAQLAWTCDTLGNVTWYNKRWLDYTGMSFEQMKGWDWSKVQHPDHLERVVARVKRSAESGEPWEDTFPLRGKDGEYRWFLSRAVPIRNGSGEIVRWFGTNTDISDRIALEARVREQAEALAGESRRKDEFLAMLSHELRNPIAPIRAAVHLLRSRERGTEDAIQKQAHDIIERQTGNITKMVNDLLEVSRVTSGRIRLNLQTVDMNEVVAHAMETVKPLFEQRRQKAEFQCCPLPVWCHADATRLEEVFTNLLNNAAKYTPEGGRIDIWCENYEEDEDARFAQFRVRDTGVGIEKELLPRIFDLFTQADRSLDRSQGGLGIGLSLAMRLVELHGGTIDVKSDGPGKGAEFIVRLALAEAPASKHEAPQEPAMTANGTRVLIVDDNIDMVMMLASTLRESGYSVQSAYTGPDGLRIAQQWQPEVALLDIGLPGLDGYEVARRLRADPGLGSSGEQVRLIALTGYGREADIDRARDAGFDAHMVKPFEFDQLERAMRSTQTMR